MKNKVSQVERKRRQKKIDDAIVMINDVCKTKLAPSEVHGIGVFAIRDIKKGERVYADAMPCMIDVPYKKLNKIRPEIRKIILERFPMVKEGSQFLAPDTLMQIYLNHSETPNYDNKTGKALKKIKEGEEIFENYKEIDGWDKIWKWLK